MAKLSSSNGIEKFPKLRFPEFTDSWHATEFGSLVQEYSNRTKTENEDILLSATIEGMFLNSELFDHQRGESNKGYKKIDKGTLVLSTQNLHLGNANVNLRFEHGIVSPAYKTYHIKNCNLNLIAEWIKTEKAKKFFYDATTVGASVCRRNVEWDTLYTQMLYLPSIEEQEKLSLFISLLSRRIKNQKRLVDNLKKYKRGALSALFPKKGEITPQYRFAGFTKPWEQRKLGEIVDVRSGKDYKHLSEGNIPVYGTGGYMLSVNEALSYSEDAIGIGRKGTIDKPYILKAPFWTVDTLFYAVPRANIDLYFVFDIFQNIDWKKKDESTGVPSLSKAAINEIDILVPHHAEQCIIGKYFSEIDNLITLHQHKYDTLLSLKNAILQQMFI